MWRKTEDNKKEFLRSTSKPSYVVQKIVVSNLVAIHNIKTTIVSNKPEYIEMSTLELSEVPMYGFPYD